MDPVIVVRCSSTVKAYNTGTSLSSSRYWSLCFNFPSPERTVQGQVSISMNRQGYVWLGNPDQLLYNFRLGPVQSNGVRQNAASKSGGQDAGG